HYHPARCRRGQHRNRTLGARQAGVPGHARRAYRRAGSLASIRDVHRNPHASDRRLPPAKGSNVLKWLAGLLLLATAAAAAPAPREHVQAVEVPYYLYPRALWEREQVWLKTIGIRTVEFSIP